MATTRAYGPLDTDNDPTSDVPTSLVGLVRNWANRDVQALPNAIIMDAIRYSVDMAYRTLRIPPLEHTVLWTDATALETASIGDGNIYQSVTALSVPPDLIEFIHIRGTDANGLTTRVFNEKSDIRSFWDICSNHYDQSAFWSRQGDQVLITPSFGNAARGFYGGGSGPETQIEMYYYRRLPALNATFNVTPQNFDDDLLNDPSTTPTTGSTALWFDDPTMVDVADYRAGNLTAVIPPLDPNTDTLWFHGPLIDYDVTAANYAAGGRLLEGTGNASTSQGQLWFPPERITERVAAAQMRSGLLETTMAAISPTTGQPDRTAIDSITLIRNGVESTLTEITDGDVVAGEWEFLTSLLGNRLEILIAPQEAGDVYEINYFVAPTAPTGTAHDAENTGLGIITSFDFHGLIDYDSINTNHATLRVSETADDFFNVEIGFMITGSSFVPTPGVTTAYAADTDPTSRVAFYFTGKSVPNWFKDENEKIVLYGALAQCFAYLQEDDQSGKYLQLMQKEIDDLNNEDRIRDSSGGNVQVQYSARGLI